MMASGTVGGPLSTGSAASVRRELPEDIRVFLDEIGLHEGPVMACPLSGGVSSDIWMVDTGRRRLCIKRALPVLKVAADWRAPIERSAYEYRWFARVKDILPDSVPDLVGRKSDGTMFAMAFLLPETYPLWKSLLLRGKVDPAFAASVGASLAAIHSTTAKDPRVARDFASDAIFHALRLEPYFLATATKHPFLAGQLAALVERTAGTRLALVHGDVSPKNILAGPSGPVFLDAECAWYGDPAFDLAFCLNHLLLKCLPVRQQADRLGEAFTRLTEAYLAAVTWEDRLQLEERCAALLPALLLARIDGKSPVEYVVDESQRMLVRAVARPLVARPVKRLHDVKAAWLEVCRGKE